MKAGLREAWWWWGEGQFCRTTCGYGCESVLLSQPRFPLVAKMSLVRDEA